MRFDKRQKSTIELPSGSRKGTKGLTLIQGKANPRKASVEVKPRVIEIKRARLPEEIIIELDEGVVCRLDPTEEPKDLLKTGQQMIRISFCDSDGKVTSTYYKELDDFLDNLRTYFVWPIWAWVERELRGYFKTLS